MSTALASRRRFLRAGSAGLLALGLPARGFGAAKPVLVAVDAEFFDPSSTADDAILLGAQLAADMINARGGVLRGRPIEIVISDNRSLPARGVANVEQLAGLPDLVGYLCGKFSPVALEQLPHIHRLQLPLLNPWSAADAIVVNHFTPNYAFRLGLRDSIVMQVLLEQIHARGLERVGLIAPSTAWGRSCQLYLEHYLAATPQLHVQLVGLGWHSWGSLDGLIENHHTLRGLGAQAMIFVGNEPEGAALVRALNDEPEQYKLPIYSHWGITGGRFPELCGPALHHVELHVAQSFSLARARGPHASAVIEAAMQHFRVEDPLAVPSMTGLGPAFDLVHLIALAVERAGSTHRPDIQQALEKLPPYDGLVKYLAPAFTPTRHEALGFNDVLMCRFDRQGRLQVAQAD